MNNQQADGVRKVVGALNDTLRLYLEAQYHIKNLSLIEERSKLLEQVGSIYQLPYVEATPVYQKGGSYDQLDIPDPAKTFLTTLSKFDPGIGIFKEPYVHQVQSLESFLTHKQDLLIATGTGSGKTESFLMPILSNLAIEFTDRPQTSQHEGIRALLLYPMNALVNDQLSRIRKLIGDERVAELFKGMGGRPVRFGSYTSRTPYPGRRSAGRDERELEPIFRDFYIKYADDIDRVEVLKGIGKWPSKNIKAFYGADKITKEVYKSGKRVGQEYNRYHWDKRFHTHEDDRELLTRHEMHASCPDILITNYSMLEYMMMRPIERSLFTSTRDWLASDSNNEFVLVLDEAHMYRGTGGAEVALLIRRLQARLGIPRERMRCILTSASLDSEEFTESDIIQFASDLTGLNAQSSREFCLVKGEQEKRSSPHPGSKSEGEKLASLDLHSFLNYAQDSKAAERAVSDLAEVMVWVPFQDVDLRQYLFDNLEGFGPVELLIQLISGNAVEFSELCQLLFPDSDREIQQRATESLLALCPFARRTVDNRVLIPTRLHLFFRGLASLYVCINPNCNHRLSKSQPDDGFLLGRQYTSPITQCECGSRVYELLTHRDCGVAFIRGYIRGIDGDFLWHEPSGHVGHDSTASLTELHLLVDGDPHQDTLGETVKVWVDIKTGQLKRIIPDNTGDYFQTFIPNTTEPDYFEGHPRITFSECPVCLHGWRGDRTKIMDLATKGEAPFANLVKTQVITQPARTEENKDHPNGGRKTLLFSDGRQKAARLARDIPREVELDSFRQAISLASRRLQDIEEKPKLNLIYPAFISVASDFNLAFFDGENQQSLLDHVKAFDQRYEADLEEALDGRWYPDSPDRFKEALIRQLCSRHYSLSSSTIGYLEPTKSVMRLINKAIDESTLSSLLDKDQRYTISIIWINDLLYEFAFDKSISANQRSIAAGFRRRWGNNGKFRPATIRVIRQHLSLDQSQMSIFQDILIDKTCEKHETVYFLDPDCLLLIVDLECSWYQCLVCNSISLVNLNLHCVNCGSDKIEKLDPMSLPEDVKVLFSIPQQKASSCR